MDNPYQSPTKAIAPPVLQPFRWTRVLAWAVLINAASMVVGFASGLTMGHWEVYGSTMEAAIENARVVRRIAYGVVGAVLYWRLAVPVRQRLLHVVVVFVAAQLIGLALAFLVFDVPAKELLDVGSLGRSALAAAVGLAVASLDPRGRVRPSRA